VAVNNRAMAFSQHAILYVDCKPCNTPGKAMVSCLIIKIGVNNFKYLPALNRRSSIRHTSLNFAIADGRIASSHRWTALSLPFGRLPFCI
jgi:deoxycytidylate deaminase